MVSYCLHSFFILCLSGTLCQHPYESDELNTVLSSHVCHFHSHEFSQNWDSVWTVRQGFWCDSVQHSVNEVLYVLRSTSRSKVSLWHLWIVLVDDCLTGNCLLGLATTDLCQLEIVDTGWIGAHDIPMSDLCRLLLSVRVYAPTVLSSKCGCQLVIWIVFRKPPTLFARPSPTLIHTYARWQQ